jgi:Fic family protein
MKGKCHKIKWGRGMARTSKRRDYLMWQRIARFCAEEVERQGDELASVADMFDAWCHALSVRKVTEINVRAWGMLVKPINDGCWRKCGVRVGSHIAPPPQEVPRLMQRWIENLPNMTPEQAYKEFQLVHPFRDGNGRVGKIVYNLLSGSLEDPKLPPNFFNCSNP